MSSTKANDNGECRLMALPPELRIKIWKLSLTHDYLSIDVLTADGPSRSLLATCRQIKDEAGAECKEALEQYWTNGRFELHCDTQTSQIQSLSDAKLAKIDYLHIYGRGERYFVLNGSWHCTCLLKHVTHNNGGHVR